MITRTGLNCTVMATIAHGFKFEEVADESAQKNVASLKELLVNEDLPELSNEQMLHFLVRSDHVLPAAKDLIQSCYQLKGKAPSIFNNRRMESVRTSLERIEICPMPERTEDGCAVVFVRLIDTNYKNISLDDYFKLLFMTVDSLLYRGPLSGIIPIFDLAGISLMHLTRVKIAMLKTAMTYFQNGLPVKLKAVHCVNSVSFIDVILKLIRPFVDNAFLQKLHFHSRNMDLDAFHSNHLEKRCLPEELGGELPSTKVLHLRHVETLSELEQHFVDEEKQRNPC